MKKILVTGGAGYIGSHVVHELLNEGYSVRVYDDFSSGFHSRVNIKSCEIVIGNILDRKKLQKAMKGIDGVIHLAAKKSVEESVNNPLKYYENNVSGTINVLVAMKLEGIKRLVFSSSAAVYAPTNKEFISELDETTPISPYGETKLLCEQIISLCSKTEALSHISLRYFNVAGAIIPALVDKSTSNLMPKVYFALQSKKPPEIYGTSYPTPDGTCLRDYVHAYDIAIAHTLALRKTENEFINRTYNVGSGKGYSVREVIAEICRTVGADIDPIELPARFGDPPRLVASIGNIQKDLGWKPTLGLKEMINSSWKKNLE